jgi:hypothetical protein
VEQFPADLDRMLGALAVDQRDLGVFLPRAHQMIDAFHVVKHRRDGGVALRFVLAPQFDCAARAHDGFGSRDPLRVRRAREKEHRKQEAEPDGERPVESACLL